ncbi:MAG: folate family ECF transporter S component [Oscillospiraceae bacterium]|nr:folate family ECF transporter S component [Oscillospiraceae bacterium]
MIATMGVLIAIQIVLTRFMSIQAWNIRIGFGFVPIVIAAVIFGPVPAMIVAGVSDVLGALLVPTGPFFIGFTLTAILTGLTFGLLLHKEQTIGKSIMSVLIVQGVYGLLLNTLWISILYGTQFGPLLATRAVEAAILAVVQFATIRMLSELVHRLPGRLEA